MKYLLIACLFFTTLPASSQEVEKKRTCRILYVERPGDAPTEAYLFDGVQSHKVLLPSLNFSRVIELPKGDITVGLIPYGIDDPEAFPDGAPTVKIPEQQTDLYLLLSSDPKNKVLPVRIKAININNKNLKPGHTLWINLSKHKIAAKLGKENVMIPPMKITISPPPLTTSGYFLAHFLYQPDSKGKFLPIMKKSWWFDATSKNLGLIIDSSGRLPKIFTLRDRRAPDTEEKSKNAK